MKIYICGKVTGLTQHEAETKFANTKRQLAAIGISKKNIVNPMELVEWGTKWPEAMNICMAQLDNCGAIYIQKDWRESFGARKEITHAMSNKYQLYYEEADDIPVVLEAAEI